MLKRIPSVLPLAAIAAAVSACGGETVTSLPSAEPVASHAAQFCSDAASYLESLVPALIPLVCEEAVAQTPGTACQTDYDACVSVASNDVQQVNLGSTFLPDCETTVAQCKVDVGRLSQCISDLGNALTALSNGVTAETACRAHSTTVSPFGNLPLPASCATLPSGCPSGATTVSVSGSGG